MSDIVDEIKNWRDELGYPTPGEVMDRAAAEIARLRAAVRFWQSRVSGETVAFMEFDDAAPPQPAAVKRRCGQCAWWSEIEDLRPKGVGRCVRHTPVVGIDGMSAQWPRTVTSEWCGEFKPRENA